MAIALCALLMTAAAWAAGKDSYTVIVSLDGFRWDYPETFDTPFLDRMGREGVKAVMRPAFPSKTFPNHYTLATGLYPDHHGLIANTFVDRARGVKFSLANSQTRNDPRYYGGEPIWLTAKRQGVTSATVFWVGSDVPVLGEYADYWHDYQAENKQFTYQRRCHEILRLMALPEPQRPHLLMAYFDDPDRSGHINGPISRDTRRAMEQLDSLLQDLWQGIQALPYGDEVNFIVTGDHGMTWISPERQIKPWQHLSRHWVASMDNDFPVLINATRPEFIDSIVDALSRVDHLRVWRRGHVPRYLHYGNNSNISDVVVLPDVGWCFGQDELKNKGSHGYDPTASDMWVAFRAIGPDFKRGYTRPNTFDNVCVYPLLCHLLGLLPAHNDGSLEAVSDLLDRQPR